MNRLHRWCCGSNRYAGTVRSKLVPWVLGEADLGDDVLEIGPGPGITTGLLRSRVPRLTALEIDPWGVRALEARFAKDADVTVVQGDATTMPLQDGRFSAAICLTMLHHVGSAQLQDRVLSEVARVLRHGGMFICSDSTDSFQFRLYHLFDTCVPVDPGAFPDRLRRAGFADPKVNAVRRSFRFRATRA